MCLHMSTWRFYMKYVESSIDTSDTEVEENHNLWNALLAAGPVRLGDMQSGIVVPLLAGHYLQVHGVVSKGATAIRLSTVCELLDTKRETGREAAGMWALSRTAWVRVHPGMGHSFVCMRFEQSNSAVCCTCLLCLHADAMPLGWCGLPCRVMLNRHKGVVPLYSFVTAVVHV